MLKLTSFEEKCKTSFHDSNFSKSIGHDHQSGNHSLDYIQFNLLTVNCALVISKIWVKSMRHANNNNFASAFNKCDLPGEIRKNGA